VAQQSAALLATRILKAGSTALESVGRARFDESRHAPDERLRRKAARLRVVAAELCRLHGFRFEVEGAIPREPCVLVANHVSYVDAPVLVGLTPCLPIAKAEIAGWPLIGAVTRALGVIFVRRSSPHSGAVALRRALRSLGSGVSVIGFPEGTTTAGNRLLDFRRGLFGLARIANVPVVPIAVAYASPEIAWVGDEWFVPHYLKTAMRAETLVSVRVGSAIAPLAAPSAIELAELTRTRIAQMLWRSR
jgi:1-acyl-sn-glycerol-3-phosphate acyltransferase